MANNEEKKKALDAAIAKLEKDFGMPVHTSRFIVLWKRNYFFIKT